MILFDKMRNKKREEYEPGYDQVPELYRKTYQDMQEAVEKGDFQKTLRLAQGLKDQGRIGSTGRCRCLLLIWGLAKRQARHPV